MVRKKVSANTIGLLLSLAMVAASGGVLAMNRNWFNRRTLARVSLKSTDIPETQRHGNPIADFETELVTLTSHGFEPAEITRPSHPFLLMVDNRSDIASPSLVLIRDTGVTTQQMSIPRQTPNWTGMVDLPPGNYQLVDLSHSNWICHIRLTVQ